MKRPKVSVEGNVHEVELSAIRKISLRLLPLLFLCIIAAYLDRVNVGFAALGMNRDLGFTVTAYSIGGGIFFLSYFIFEVPSNYVLEKVGARIWIARIMITWAVISGLSAFIWNESSFYAMRFLLGAAEAGFVPGVFLYLTRWFPARYLGKAMFGFLVGIPISIAFGSLISGYLLQLEGLAGLKGWQWLFLIEAIPSVLLGIAVLALLPNKPEDAKFLSIEERNWLAGELTKDEAGRSKHSVRGFLRALTSPKVLLFGLADFGIVSSTYGVVFFLPMIVKGFGLGNETTGLVTAVPYVLSVVAMVFWSKHSDRSGERRWHAASACFVGAFGLAFCFSVNDPVIQMIAFSAAAVGIMCAMTIFWTLPATFLVGPAAAGGIAFINSIGNLGGFVGPYIVGFTKDATGGYGYALTLLGAFIAITGIMVLRMVPARSRSRETVGERQPAE